LEKAVNAILALGFIILVLGIGLGILGLSQRMHLSTEAILVVLGLMLLLVGAFAAKLFERSVR